jgi:hypothetical protein
MVQGSTDCAKWRLITLIMGHVGERGTGLREMNGFVIARSAATKQSCKSAACLERTIPLDCMAHPVRPASLAMTGGLTGGGCPFRQWFKGPLITLIMGHVGERGTGLRVMSGLVIARSAATRQSRQDNPPGLHGAPCAPHFARNDGGIRGRREEVSGLVIARSAATKQSREGRGIDETVRA